jgi:hypothetical protein
VRCGGGHGVEESKRGDAGSEVWKRREGRRETGVCLEGMGGDGGEALRRMWFDAVEMVSRALAGFSADAGGSG